MFITGVLWFDYSSSDGLGTKAGGEQKLAAPWSTTTHYIITQAILAS